MDAGRVSAAHGDRWTDVGTPERQNSTAEPNGRRRSGLCQARTGRLPNRFALAKQMAGQKPCLWPIGCGFAQFGLNVMRNVRRGTSVWPFLQVSADTTVLGTQLWLALSSGRTGR